MSYTARLILSRRVFRYAPHTSSEGSQDSETVPSAVAPVTDSQVVSLRDVFMSGHAIRRCGQFPRYAETVRIPLVPRSSVQTLLRYTGYRGPRFPPRGSAKQASLLCSRSAASVSAESSEPSGKEAVPPSLPPVSSALTALSRSASTRSLTSRRRPDSPVPTPLPLCFYS